MKFTVKPKNLAICVNDYSAYSETFIKAHLENIEASIIYLSELPSNLNFSVQESQIKETVTIFNLFKKKIRKLISFIENKKKEIRVGRRIKKEYIGIILAEYGQIGVAVLDTCRKNNIPLVVHFHGFDAYKKDVIEKYRKHYLELFDYASKIIVVSRDMENQLCYLGAPKSKIIYNLYGVDISKFPPSDVVNSELKFSFIGRFVEKKAPYLAILAFQKVIKDFPAAKFHMVGDGPLFDVCRQLIHSLSIQNNVILHGVLPHEKIAELMGTSRAYIQHSIVPDSGDSEGTPNSVLEAMASGIPVISTKHAGIKDVIINGETGFLVEECDIEAMAKYMVLLLKDAALASKMGKQAHCYAVQNFSMKASISRLKLILMKEMD